ncbi:MAG: T9SS type A sorting domain-containing protein [Bacteroidetes bacterium]|mgnify:CR=1 FL=1|jgi:hypothetical protein|nr:T9SS type A sorting domain-containing protein [Bacteroidota bacterium]MBP8916034.1 T9SS type A sorting domain-containing protein [Chitinophagales bacterium]MBP9795383.1 T9SS type A sorting domain-containing protein [Chitinophagales bacterium]
MKKDRANVFSFKLSAYATFAASFLSIHKTEAQVIYTDIDPDIIYDEKLEGGGLDIDANGTIDFVFLNSSFTFYDYIFLSYRLRQDIIVGPYIFENAIAGISNQFNIGSSEFTRYYPYAININSLIDPSLEWQTFYQQALALRTFDSDGVIAPCIDCFWYDYFLPDVIDHYLGIRFIDNDGMNHYGWIRCDVLDEGRTLVIKDYAYETQPEHAILAGDTAHFVSLEENANNFNANIYSFNNSIFVKLNELTNLIEINIFELLGKKIYTGNIVKQFTEIKLMEAQGAYIVELISSEGRYSKKIIIN